MEKLINDFKISFTKGDTYALAVKFKNIAEDLRAAYFTVKENPEDAPIIQKSLGAGIDKIDDREYKAEKTYKVQLQSVDTIYLEANVQYLYDLQVTLDNVVKTVLSGVFVVNHSVSGATSTIMQTLDVAVDDEVEAEILTTPATNGVEYEQDPVACAQIGKLEQLNTSAKETVVQAVNEVDAQTKYANKWIDEVAYGRVAVPKATNADQAKNADSANKATNATNADRAERATYAGSATNADNATNDGDGNNIAETYVKKKENTDWLKYSAPTNDSLIANGTRLLLNEAETYIKVTKAGAPSGVTVTWGHNAYCVSGLYCDIPWDLQVKLCLPDGSMVNTQVKRADGNDATTCYIELFGMGAQVTVGEEYKIIFLTKAQTAVNADTAKAFEVENIQYDVDSECVISSNGIYIVAGVQTTGSGDFVTDVLAITDYKFYSVNGHYVSYDCNTNKITCKSGYKLSRVYKFPTDIR